MKLTDKQKKQLRKEVEQEKRPRILNFETEINKKKNQNLTYFLTATKIQTQSLS